MKNLFFLIFLLFATFCAESSDKNNGSLFSPDKKILREFQGMKFGLFVHWGPVSLKGTEIGWSRGREVPVEEYDQLYKHFNPLQFNAGEWISLLKDAGMKYLVFTSRHHDGFSNWVTQYSDYNIGATPFKKDVLMELKNACEKQGILFGTYYSICDWKHPDYPLGSPGGKTKKEDSSMERFIPFIKGQTKELIEKYNSRILWFDGEWEEPWTHEMGLDLYRYLKGLNKNILINNRIDKGRKGMEGITMSKEFAGDFATPEQRIGTYDITNPWESCITICRQWAWKPDDKLKSLEECLFTLLKTVGGGGNLLLNVGPMPDGRIESRQAEVLRGIGNWLKKNGESVYGTTGGPWRPCEWMASTRKGNTIYLHLLNNTRDLIDLPFPENVKIKSCRIIYDKTLNFKKENNSIEIDLQNIVQTGPVTTIEIKIAGNSLKLGTISM